MSSTVGEPGVVQQRIATVQDALATLFSARLEVDVPSFDTDLFETGVLDSLSFVELLLGLEQRFGVKVTIDDLETEHFRSIRKIAEFVMRCNGAVPSFE